MLHCLFPYEHSLLECFAMFKGRNMPTFRMNILPPFSELKRCLTFYPEDTRSTFLRKVDKCPANCTVSHPGRLPILLVVTSMRFSNQAQNVQLSVTSFQSKRVQFCSHIHCIHPGIVELPSCYRVVGWVPLFQRKPLRLSSRWKMVVVCVWYSSI